MVRLLLSFPMIFIAILRTLASTTGLGWLATIANPAIALPIYAIGIPILVLAGALALALRKN